MVRYALALAAVSTAVLTGCSTTLDADKAETEIAKAVRVQAGVPVKSVECPEDVKAKKGDKFTCTVTAKDGTSGKVNVTQKDDEGNIAFDAPFIHMDEAEASIVEQIEKQSGSTGVTVDCPDIVVGKAKDTFKCTGQAGSQQFTVNATQTDGQGRFRFKVVQ